MSNISRIQLVTEVGVPPERCFDLARDLDLHKRSMSHTNEEAIAGRTSGLIGFGEEVTWRAKHFGMFHTHQARITAFDRPRYFRDEMVAGRFKSFVHDHYFQPNGNGTLMLDVLEFQSPFGILGRIVDRCVMGAYMRRLLERRNQLIANNAEGGV